MEKAFVLIVVLLAFLSACNLNQGRSIQYSVTGSTVTAEVLFENSSEGITRSLGVAIPWSYSFISDPGDFVYISAQKDDDPATDVTVTIYVDGRVLQTSTASGAYAMATASGSP